MLPRTVVLLRYVSATGATITLPVRAAQEATRFVVLVGQADNKRWWRHFRHAAAADVWLDGRWHPAIGEVSPANGGAASLYRRRFPRTAVADNAILVDLRCDARISLNLRGRPLFLRWFATVTAGEFAGFAVPAVAGALTAQAPVAAAFVAILAAGAVEGTMLGLAQATVLRYVLPRIAMRRWVAATAVGAVLAYAIGMLPSALAGHWADLPAAVVIIAGLILGSALLASIGTAQWLVLRTVLPRSASWIATTAGAWLAGLGVFLGFATPLWQPGQSITSVVVIGAAGGLLMAAVTSAITGASLGRLLR
ncbi:hypothetical protein [Paractinoplanes hotanensis]|uniref:Uncharacterized protein n=1 Tax=Paractinoplanes hotanensis TaxID=2906497 RepID=A0ABT0YF32_9ACTN|nr:hypothetical protein [Actinoplanes hotanensis]MCM4084661.1 hypothetical protein [Actinoplanes hotanensis]